MRVGEGEGEGIGAGWVRYGMRGIVLILRGEGQVMVGVYVDDRLWVQEEGVEVLICRYYRKVQGGRGV